MFSGSNAFQGGGPSGRPGGPQYGQSPFGSQPPSGPMGSQPTGFGGAAGGLQPQMTGYPQQQQQQQPTMQPQYTGYPGMAGPQQQQFQQPPPQQPQPTGFPSQLQQQQPQPTGFPTQPQQAQQTGFNTQSYPQAAAPRQRPQPTGMTSSQMANSFKTSSEQPPLPPPPSNNTGARIPKQRLSFITADDQAKFEQLFKSAVGTGQALSGDKSRDLLLRSKLPGNTLGDIWYVIYSAG